MNNVSNVKCIRRDELEENESVEAKKTQDSKINPADKSHCHQSSQVMGTINKFNWLRTEKNETFGNN